LGIKFNHLPNGSLLLIQGKYLRDLLAKTNVQEAKSLPYHMITGCKLSKTSTYTFFDPTLYKYIVGAFQYCTITIHSICFSLNKVSGFSLDCSQKNQFFFSFYLNCIITLRTTLLKFGAGEECLIFINSSQESYLSDVGLNPTRVLATNII